MKCSTTINVQSENNMSFPVLIDALYTSIWSWIGADLGLSLEVYVAGSSHAVALIAVSL
jgi:hypothetical protein